MSVCTYSGTMLWPCNKYPVKVLYSYYTTDSDAPVVDPDSVHDEAVRRSPRGPDDDPSSIDDRRFSFRRRSRGTAAIRRGSAYMHTGTPECPKWCRLMLQHTYTHRYTIALMHIRRDSRKP